MRYIYSIRILLLRESDYRVDRKNLKGLRLLLKDINSIRRYISLIIFVNL